MDCATALSHRPQRGLRMSHLDPKRCPGNYCHVTPLVIAGGDERETAAGMKEEHRDLARGFKNSTSALC